MAQPQLRWGALRPRPRPAAGVARARLQGDRAGGTGDRAPPGGRVHMPGPGNRAMPAGASCARGAGAGLARWLWARGLRPQHDNTTTLAPAGGGQGAQWTRPWPGIGVHMHRPSTDQGPEGQPWRWRALLVEGEGPAAGVAGGGARGRSIQPPGALMGPSIGPELGVYWGLTGLSMRSHWPHPTVVVCSEIGYYRSAAL